MPWAHLRTQIRNPFRQLLCPDEEKKLTQAPVGSSLCWCSSVCVLRDARRVFLARSSALAHLLSRDAVCPCRLHGLICVWKILVRHRRRKESMSERGIPPAVPDYSKLTILSQPRIRPACGSIWNSAPPAYRSCGCMRTVHHFFILFIVSIRRNKADAARN